MAIAAKCAQPQEKIVHATVVAAAMVSVQKMEVVNATVTTGV